MPATINHFEETLLPYLDAAYSLARWLTRNSHDAEDVVQESYLKALHSFHTFRTGADGRAWLLKIVRNTCYTWLRKNRAHQFSIEPVDESQHPDSVCLDPEAALIGDANRQLVRKALEELPLEYRETVVLRELEGFSYKQISEISGIPLGTVMSRLSRARKVLQKRLRETVEEVGK